MRLLFFFFICFSILSCQTEKNTKKPEWIIGKWVRSNDKPNQTTFETWYNNYTGIGYTLQETDTVFKENLSIIEKDNSLFLQVTGVNEQPTLFKFINQTDSSFTCENKQNEFPKKITYWAEKNQLKAKIANDDFSVDFIFDRR
ncbi:DUF6265 family protein [Tenacibaculum sp. IB213877]|uniref:DUF6265 family protein n=1 Tax=Tenacibaculum sp. IB213877 TaxID=3097351 RepID=UPI002A5A673A|nr:DUF6265 family protein [Tenacibaculum sp. IB213877]MDY0780130.1 DUF6265 family protein [Tenacibaculum sp. IB213877]